MATHSTRLPKGTRIETFHNGVHVKGTITGSSQYGANYTVRLDGEPLDREFHPSTFAVDLSTRRDHR